MRVCVLTVGTEGDLRPFLALGAELVARGHSVNIVSHGIFEDLVTTAKLDFTPLVGDPRAALATATGQDILEHNDRYGPVKLMRMCMQICAPFVEAWLRTCYAAARDADVIMVNHLALPFGVVVGEALDMPVTRGFFFPVTQTGDYPAPGTPDWFRLGPAGNRWTYRAREEVLWLAIRSVTNKLRRDVLGLPPLGRSNPLARLDRYGWPVLYSYSERICPRPRDWPENVEITGFWFNPDQELWVPPADLEEFIAAGPAPISVGFGSMRKADPERLDALVTEAVQSSGQRAVVLSGWHGLGEGQVSERLYVTDAVPHAWLFPRMQAVVHHGGAGTTGAGLRAGVPNVLVPFLPDQHFWGTRVESVGAGPAALPHNHVTSHQLAAAIDVAAGDPAMLAAASGIGRAVRAERGVARAADVLDRAFAA